MRPTTAGSCPSRRCQSEWLISATALPGRSSLASNRRPAARRHARASAERGRDACGGHALRLALGAEVVVCALERAHALEGAGARLPVEVAGGGEQRPSAPLSAALGQRLAHAHETSGSRVGQRAVEPRVERREEGDAGADAQAHAHDGEQAERLVPQQRADGVTQRPGQRVQWRPRAASLGKRCAGRRRVASAGPAPRRQRSNGLEVPAVGRCRPTGEQPNLGHGEREPRNGAQRSKRTANRPRRINSAHRRRRAARYGPSGITASSGASSAEEGSAEAAAFLRLPRVAFE